MRRHILFCFFAGILISEVCAQDGATLFRQNCSACHQIGRGRLVGPDLMNVHERRDSVWIGNFIRSSQSVVKSGDPVAVQLFNDFNKIVMPDNTHLSDEDIKAIIAYISAGGGDAQPSVASPAASRPPQLESGPVARREITQEELEAATRQETSEERSERLTTMFYKHVILTLFGLSILFCLLILLILKYKTGNRTLRKREVV